ncbi:hypothetical protein ACOME3_006545 [Neoechinorhynchus agilis]
MIYKMSNKIDNSLYDELSCLRFMYTKEELIEPRDIPKNQFKNEIKYRFNLKALLNDACPFESLFIEFIRKNQQALSALHLECSNTPLAPKLNTLIKSVPMTISIPDFIEKVLELCRNCYELQTKTTEIKSQSKNEVVQCHRRWILNGLRMSIFEDLSYIVTIFETLRNDDLFDTQPTHSA